MAFWKKVSCMLKILTFQIIMVRVFTMSELKQITSTRPIFRTRNLICAPDRARKKKDEGNQSQCAPLIEKQLETIIFVLCYL